MNRLKERIPDLAGKFSGAELDNAVVLAMRQVRDDLIDEKLLYQEAQKEVDEESEKEVEATLNSEIDKLVKGIGTLLQLEKLLKTRGTNIREFKKRKRKQIQIKHFLEKKIGAASRPSPREIQDYYREHVKDYSREKEVQWRQIMIRFDKFKTKEEARCRAEECLERIKKGEDFASVAKECSHGIFAANGGLWRFFVKRGTLAEDIRVLETEGFKLKEGEISDIIESAKGYHILKIEHIKGGNITFDEAQDEIRQKIGQEKFDKNRRKLMKKLRKQAHILVEEPFTLFASGALVRQE